METDIKLQAPAAPGRTRLQEFLYLLGKNKLAVSGLVIFILFLFTALLGVVLTSGSDPVLDPALVRLEEKMRPPLSVPRVRDLNPEEVPAFGVYLLGTDNLGRDVFSRMMQGAWVSLTVGFVAVGIAVLIGVFMGGIAGYFGQNRIRVDQIILACALFAGFLLVFMQRFVPGITLFVIVFLYLFYSLAGRKAEKIPGLLRKGTMTTDTLVMRIVDIMLCFPSFFLILTVVALLPASIYNIMIVIGMTSWMGTARFVRAEFLSLREQDFVTAARALGVNKWRIIFRHMVPNAIAPVLVSATIGIATAILTEAGLSFLGFGVPPPHATWGNILSSGKDYIFDAPWLTFIPGIAILIVVLSFNLFGEGLRDIANPRLRER